MNVGTPQRIPQLDGIRGIAILLVLIWHYFVSTIHAVPGTPLAYIQKALWLSWSGVDLFFVLSGFLIGGILLDNRQAENFFSVFYTRRALRIFPLYYGWLLIFWLFARVAGAPFQWIVANPLPWWSYVTYTQNIVGATLSAWGPIPIGVTWSLAVEEQFYLLLPLLIRLTSPRRLPYVLVALIALAPLIRILLFQRLSGNADHAFQATYTLLPCRMDTLLLGTLAAWVLRFKPLLIRRWWLLCVLFITALVIASLTLHLSNFRLAYYGYTVLALFYVSLLLLAITTSGLIARITTLTWLGALGTLAYGIYMFHQFVLGFFYGTVFHSEPLLQSWSAAAISALAICVTVLLAQVSWTHFEKPLVVRGHSKHYQV